MPHSVPHNKTLPVTLAALIILLLTLCAHPASALAAEMEVSSQPVIVIGGDRDYPPYEFLDKNGKPTGYNVDLTRAIADVMGMNVAFRFGGWSEMRNALLDGSVGVLQGISFSEDRTRTLSFSPPHTIINHAISPARAPPRSTALKRCAARRSSSFKTGSCTTIWRRSALRQTW